LRKTTLDEQNLNLALQRYSHNFFAFILKFSVASTMTPELLYTRHFLSSTIL
jgi:hypothetical protein